MKTAVWASILFLVGCTGGLSSSVDNLQQPMAIIGGQESQDGDAAIASTVALVVNSESGLQAFCSGILISKNLVITAGHCLNAFQQNPSVQVAFGRTLSGSVLRKIDRAISYEMTQPRLGDSNVIAVENDIAVLKLAQNAPEGFDPVPLLANASALSVGQEIILAGFGQVSEQNSQTSTVLKSTLIQIAGLEGKKILLDQSQGTGSCYGDSGGPAFIKTDRGLIAIGATRGTGDGYRDCHHMAIYTLLAGYQDFINKIAEIIEGDKPQFVN